MQRRRIAVPTGAPGGRAVDEANRLHAAGYRRLFAGGKYQSRAYAFSPRAPGAEIDDPAGGTARDDVAEGVSSDSRAARQRQRTRVTRISHAIADVSAALEFLSRTLFGQARPNGGKNLRHGIQTRRRLRGCRSAGGI